VKVKATAAKRWAMSYERMKAREAEPQAEVDRWRGAAEVADADYAEEAKHYGGNWRRRRDTRMDRR